jgi:hypothetical protein
MAPMRMNAHCQEGGGRHSAWPIEPSSPIYIRQDRLVVSCRTLIAGWRRSMHRNVVVSVARENLQRTGGGLSRWSSDLAKCVLQDFDCNLPRFWSQLRHFEIEIESIHGFFDPDFALIHVFEEVHDHVCLHRLANPFRDNRFSRLAVDNVLDERIRLVGDEDLVHIRCRFETAC